MTYRNLVGEVLIDVTPCADPVILRDEILNMLVAGRDTVCVTCMVLTYPFLTGATSDGFFTNIHDIRSLAIPKNPIASARRDFGEGWAH